MTTNPTAPIRVVRATGLRAEPALIAGAVQAIIALAIAFGVHLSRMQIGAIMGVIGPILAVIVRSQVTPTVPQ